MYIYRINKDGYLDSHIEKETELTGYIENYAVNEWTRFDRAWFSEDKLVLNHEDESFKYRFDNGELIEIPFDNTAILQERAEAIRKAQIEAEIREVYTIEDEIAFMYKDNSDNGKKEYRAFVEDVKSKHKKMQIS